MTSRPQLRTPPRILLIDDSEICRRLIRAQITEEECEVIEAENGPIGLEIARSGQPDIIILDLNLPGWNGFDTLRNLKEDPRTRAIPVLFVSSTASTLDRARGLDLGAIDFLSKPPDPVELRARIRVALRAKQYQDLLESRALIDGLTGLGNRHALQDRLSIEWAVSRRRRTTLSVLIADLDHFKGINDRHGHFAGDLILRATASALQSSARGGDFVARYGGEEFVVLAPDCAPPSTCALAERFRSELAKLQVRYEAHHISVTASVGVASSNDPSLSDPYELLERADRALYHAKAAGRNAVWSWCPRQDGPVPVPHDFGLNPALGAPCQRPTQRTATGIHRASRPTSRKHAAGE